MKNVKKFKHENSFSNKNYAFTPILKKETPLKINPTFPGKWDAKEYSERGRNLELALNLKFEDPDIIAAVLTSYSGDVIWAKLKHWLFHNPKSQFGYSKYDWDIYDFLYNPFYLNGKQYKFAKFDFPLKGIYNFFEFLTKAITKSEMSYMIRIFSGCLLQEQTFFIQNQVNRMRSKTRRKLIMEIFEDKMKATINIMNKIFKDLKCKPKSKKIAKINKAFEIFEEMIQDLGSRTRRYLIRFFENFNIEKYICPDLSFGNFDDPSFSENSNNNFNQDFPCLD